ncbi:MAG: acyl-CoA dehydrogenase [Bacteroidota bacterium]
MKPIAHPSVNINHALIVQLRTYAAEADLLKQLHAQQLALIHQQKWFRLFVPEASGGLALSLPDALRLEESIAWIDGSIGWTVTLCAGAGWFIGFLDPELAAVLFADPAVCLAGSGKATGIAKKILGGYEVTGSWPHATGAAHATAFTANCVIEEKGLPVLEADGTPVIRSFAFLQNEVSVLNNWNSIGMRATGSNAFEVKQTTIPENRCFIINSNTAFLQDPIYQYPFLSFAEATLAVNHSGMAIRFLDLCETLIAERPNSMLQQLVQQGMQQIETCRHNLYAIIETSWATCVSHQLLSADTLLTIRNNSKQLAATARHVVDECYPHCGMLAADPDTEINRVWRNLHTASQHSLLNR